MEIVGQVFRFGIVGLMTNLILYIGYLLLTKIGLRPTLAMSLTYAVGVLASFAANRNWTFSHQGGKFPAFNKFLLVYALGYLLNFSALYYFVGHLHLPHEWVQAIVIVFLACTFFCLQRFWIFRKESIST